MTVGMIHVVGEQLWCFLNASFLCESCHAYRPQRPLDSLWLERRVLNLGGDLLIPALATEAGIGERGVQAMGGVLFIDEAYALKTQGFRARRPARSGSRWHLAEANGGRPRPTRRDRRRLSPAHAAFSRLQSRPAVPVHDDRRLHGIRRR